MKEPKKLYYYYCKCKTKQLVLPSSRGSYVLVCQTCLMPYANNIDNFTINNKNISSRNY